MVYIFNQEMNFDKQILLLQKCKETFLPRSKMVEVKISRLKNAKIEPKNRPIVIKN